MPTYEVLAHFLRDLRKLTRAQRDAFDLARADFVDDLRNDPGALRPSLRVTRVRSTGRAVREMTWAPAGRATFEYGPSVRDGEPHVVWRRIGTHEIFREPCRPVPRPG